MKRRVVSSVLILVSLLSVSCKSQEIIGLNGKELQKSQYKSFICDTELNETEIDLKVDYWREPVKFKKTWNLNIFVSKEKTMSTNTPLRIKIKMERKI